MLHHVNALTDLEDRYGLFQSLAPGGSWARVRKVWSYFGGLDDNQRDAGNWQYATFFHQLCTAYPPNHPLLQATEVLNDVTVADIVEAVLAMRALDDTGIDHRSYAFHIEEAFTALPRLFEHLQDLGLWNDSRTTALLLI